MNTIACQDDKPGEECGVFGIFAPGRDVARLTIFSFTLCNSGGAGERRHCHRGRPMRVCAPMASGNGSRHGCTWPKEPIAGHGHQPGALRPFGDPETQMALPLLDGDLFTILDAAAHGRLADVEVRLHDGGAATVVMAAPGYPYPGK